MFYFVSNVLDICITLTDVNIISLVLYMIIY